jgi:hypothetical protein
VLERLGKHIERVGSLASLWLQYRQTAFLIEIEEFRNKDDGVGPGVFFYIDPFSSNVEW